MGKLDKLILSALVSLRRTTDYSLRSNRINHNLSLGLTNEAFSVVMRANTFINIIVVIIISKITQSIKHRPRLHAV